MTFRRASNLPVFVPYHLKYLLIHRNKSRPHSRLKSPTGEFYNGKTGAKVEFEEPSSKRVSGKNTGSIKRKEFADIDNGSRNEPTYLGREQDELREFQEYKQFFE